MPKPTSSKPPLLMFAQEPDGTISASRIIFEPAGTIQPSDIFQNGIIAWAARAKYPYVGGRQNDIWSSLIVRGDQIIMLYIADYITWNTPVSLSYTNGIPRVRHCSERHPIQNTPSGYIDGAQQPSKGKVSVNYRVVCPAANLGYDKFLVCKFMPYPGGVLDLANSDIAGATHFSLGLLDLHRKSICRPPMSNIHDQGNICLHPTGSATSMTPLPHAVFDEFSSSPGNLDLQKPALLEHLYFEPIPETEDDSGIPWLEMKTEKPGQAYGNISITLPDFWSRFASLIDEFKAKKAK